MSLAVVVGVGAVTVAVLNVVTFEVRNLYSIAINTHLDEANAYHYDDACHSDDESHGCSLRKHSLLPLRILLKILCKAARNVDF